MLFDHKLAWKDPKIYREIYENSIQCPNEFWLYHSSSLDWFQTPKIAYDEKNDTWFPDASANICHNCVDRHLKNHANKTAIIWYGDEINQRKELTYHELYCMINSVACHLLDVGVRKGDIVAIYMPMIPESIAVMLACARIGAVHMVVFTGFSKDALRDRLLDSGARYVVSCHITQHGGKQISLYENVMHATKNQSIHTIFIDDLDYIRYNKSIECEYMNNVDPLFLMYTSGSSGKPKPIYHSSLGYMVYAHTTCKYIFDMREDDVYFSSSDIGWITGHTYITYSPLLHGITIVIFSGNPTYPSADRYWDIIEKEKVSIFYTAPTAIRSLSMFSDDFVDTHDLSSLRVLGSVGEPINYDAWKWYFERIGKKRCPIVDTWWQTETGGIMISPLLNIDTLKPCFASKPFFGVVPKISDGMLYIEKSWPAICMNNKKNPFISGDNAIIDKEGDIKIEGRVDDVINISGHRLSTSEMENSINSINGIVESAVVAIDHEIKGQSAFIYIVLHNKKLYNDIRDVVINKIKNDIGSIAKPDYITIVDELPKTRSGKIMRANLRKIANNRNLDNIDTTSAVDPSIFEKILKNVEESIVCPDLCRIKN